MCVPSRVQLSATPWTIALQAFVSMGFSRQEYWSGLPFPPPGDLPDPGIQRVFPVSPALEADSLRRSHLGFPGGSAGKESTWNVGYLGSIPGLGRSHGEGKDYPLQYSGLENTKDCVVLGIAKS